jgi:hypothetical protein
MRARTRVRHELLALAESSGSIATSDELAEYTFVKICPYPGGGENTLRQNIGPNGVSLVGIYQKCVGIEGCEGFDVVI